MNIISHVCICLIESVFVILRNKQTGTSFLLANQSKVDQEVADSDDSCENPSTSDLNCSPPELVTSPLMLTPTCHGGLLG